MTNPDIPTKLEYEFILENCLKFIECKIAELQKEATLIKNELSTCAKEKVSEQNSQEAVHKI